MELEPKKNSEGNLCINYLEIQNIREKPQQQSKRDRRESQVLKTRQKKWIPWTKKMLSLKKIPAHYPGIWNTMKKN